MRLVSHILVWLCFAACPALSQEPVIRELDYAQNFSIAEYPNYTLLTVRNAYRNSSREFQYALVSKETSIPDDVPSDATILRTPIENVALMETVYIGYLDAINQLDSIRAAATANYISHPAVTARVDSGDIQKIQSGQKLNIERLLLLQPDLIFTTSLGEGAFEHSPQLKRAGLSVVLTADYMERQPLARAEWVKFIAEFYDAGEAAEVYFEKVKSSYMSLIETTAKAEKKPTVFCGAPYSGVWHVPGGDSFFARFIEDAGASYLWSDDSSQGGIPLDTERVFLKAANADFWVNPSHYRSLKALFGADPRFSKFGAAQTGQVYNNTKQVGANGGNNVWERGIIHPDEVLADLIHIFHPELLPGHELIYYEQLESRF